jgi:hypothetical protein
VQLLGSNAVEFAREIAFLESALSTPANVWAFLDSNYGDAAGRATTMGGIVSHLYRVFLNRHAMNGVLSTFYRDNDQDPMVSGSYLETGTTVERQRHS